MDTTLVMISEPGRAKDAATGQLAAVLGMLWATGALASHWIGLWWGISGAALACGLLSGLQARRLLLERLRPSPGLCVLGLVAGGVMIAATYSLYPVAGRLFPALPGETAALYGLLVRIPPPVSLALLPFVILCEELVWRGVVQEALERRLGMVWGIPLAASVYALAHAPAGNGLLALLCLACGLYWSALRARTGSILVPLLAHLAWDILVFALVPLAASK